MYTWNDGTYLAHHGIKGQKWGVRRFQNPDMTYTEAGKERYSWASRTGNAVKVAKAKVNKAVTKVNMTVAKVKGIRLTDNQKKAIKIGAAVVGTALVAYGAYKVGTSPQVKQMIADGETAIADLIEERDIKNRIYDEMRTEVSDKYLDATRKVEDHVDSKLRSLYEQMEKVESMRTKENSKEVDQLIADLYNTRKEIITDRNNALKDFQKSYRIEGIGLGTTKMMKMPASRLLNRTIKEGKNIHKYDEIKINDLISGDNQFYNILKSIGEDPESYGIKYRNSRIV